MNNSFVRFNLIGSMIFLIGCWDRGAMNDENVRPDTNVIPVETSINDREIKFVFFYFSEFETELYINGEKVLHEHLDHLQNDDTGISLYQ